MNCNDSEVRQFKQKEYSNKNLCEKLLCMEYLWYNTKNSF